MKIIDLLNKIANGEEVPKKIKYRKCIFEYEEKYKEYFTENGIIPTTFDTDGIFRNIFLDYNNFLNDEVEILEEEKKIPEKLYKYMEKQEEGCYEDILRVYDGGEYEINEDMSFVIDKINEIIDYLKSKRDE